MNHQCTSVVAICAKDHLLLELQKESKRHVWLAKKYSRSYSAPPVNYVLWSVSIVTSTSTNTKSNSLSVACKLP